MGNCPLFLPTFAHPIWLIKPCREILDQAEKQIETIGKADKQED
jgi:exonuclease VII small subunit